MNLTDTQIALLFQYGFPFVVAFVIYLYRLIMSKMPANQQGLVEKTVAQVVQAVEQAQALIPSQVKKDYATKAVQGILGSLGVKASPALIDTLIESAVYEMNQGQISKAKTALIPIAK